MQNRIHLSLAHMGGEEITFIQEAFNTNWVVPLGPNVNAFEEDLEFFLGNNKYAVALSSGTAAIHLGLVILGVGQGDEVICQSFTFAASANPIKYLGANPVFVDSEKDTWNMDPVFLEKAIQDRIDKTGKSPKVIIPVHLYGMPARMREIMEIANRYNIPVLEDAAEALGSTYENQQCGTFGNLAALSFNGNKIITTSGGGALICDTIEQSDLIKFYATQARDNAPHYEHTKIGYNYRLSNVCAGIGRGQMVVLGEHIERRKEIHSLYKESLNNCLGISVMDTPSEEYNSNFWLTCILIDPAKAGFDRDQLRIYLDKKNIETRPLWKPMHMQPVFSSSPYYGDNVSESLFKVGLCLPSGSALSNEDVMYVIEAIQTFKL